MALSRVIYTIWALCGALFVLKASCGTAQHEQQPILPTESKPNILFILTDDQDLHMDSLSYMPSLKKHLIDRGTSFTRHYCTVALCCPSRVSLWTGKAAHNTNVTDLNPPYGGYPKFISEGFNDHYVPVWLQASGYNTYYIGKLFNAQSISTYNSPHAAGWTGSDFLLDPYTYRYLNATFQRNFDKPVSYEGKYTTDVVAEKAYGFLEDALEDLNDNGKPFFLTIAPTAPHSEVIIKQKVIYGNYSENTAIQAPPIPAERHKDLFKDVIVPRTPNFNPDIHGGAAWISRLPKQNRTNVDFNDHFYRSRLRALQAVDEMVDQVMIRLSEAGVLDNTYIFYSTDNGYSIGQHRRQPGKQCAFDEDINVPFIVRGPGIEEGVETDIVTTHTDLAPTFLSLAGARPPTKYDFDGQVIPLTASLQNAAPSYIEPLPQTVQEQWKQEHVNVEMWGIIMSEGKYGTVLYPNHTYKALRVVGASYDLLYTVWCSGEHELYDMTTDPYQLVNVYVADTPGPDEQGIPLADQPVLNSSVPLPEHLATMDGSASSSFQARDIDSRNPATLSPLIHRLDALLMVLKTCVGRQCTHPWESLFPAGGVSSLSDALEPKYDEFFQQGIERVCFQRCEKGYIAESEGPMWSDNFSYAMSEEMAYD